MMLTYIHWNPDPEIVNIFGLSIRYYGLLFAGGIILSVYVLSWIFKQEKLPAENLDRLTTYGVIGIFLGARLGHCLFYEPAYYLAHPLEMLLPISFDENGKLMITGFLGLASHGGGLGLIIALFFYARKTGHSMIGISDLIAIVTGLGAGFIRIANFMNSEIIGIPTTKPWAIIFERVDYLPRHPAQLYEAICYFLIFGFMLFLYKTKGEKLKNGFFFGLLLVLVFTARITIEFVKENQVGFEEGMLLNMGQILSIPYLLVGFGFMIYGLNKTKSLATEDRNNAPRP